MQRVLLSRTGEERSEVTGKCSKRVMKKLKQARGIPTKLFLMKHSPCAAQAVNLAPCLSNFNQTGAGRSHPHALAAFRQAQHQKRHPSALEVDLRGKSDNIGVCAFIDTRTVKRMCGTYMQEHATNMMYAENIISEDRTGFEHSICEMVS